MNTTISSIQRHSYLEYIWRIRPNRILFALCICLSIVLFVIFKIFYPYPDFFGDSYSYIYAAKEKLNINIWPIGYSKFLEVFHAITHSDLALVGFQYFSMQIAIIHFL